MFTSEQETIWPIHGVTMLFCDGGVIASNPSEHGGTWAWVAVDEFGDVCARSSGIMYRAEGEPFTSNNYMEFQAAVRALEAMPDGWDGTLYTDSQVTLGRLCWEWKLKGIPTKWVMRGSYALQRMGEWKAVLLQGHPTKEDLRTGFGKRSGLPVHPENVNCDQECSRLAAQYLASLQEQPILIHGG